MTRTMYDIETMSTHTSEALILSAGMVDFNLYPRGPVIGTPKLITISTPEQLSMLRRVDRGTQEFWGRQTEEARQHWLKPETAPLSVLAAVSEIGSWYRAQGDGKCEVWANGIVFDLGNLENLMHSVGYAPPWPYNAARDTRTIWKCTKKLREMPPNALGGDNSHDPIYDCLRQVWNLWEHWPDEMMDVEPLTVVSEMRGAQFPIAADPLGR